MLNIADPEELATLDPGQCDGIGLVWRRHTALPHILLGLEQQLTAAVVSVAARHEIGLQAVAIGQAETLGLHCPF